MRRCLPVRRARSQATTMTVTVKMTGTSKALVWQVHWGAHGRVKHQALQQQPLQQHQPPGLRTSGHGHVQVVVAAVDEGGVAAMIESKGGAEVAQHLWQKVLRALRPKREEQQQLPMLWLRL